MNNQELSKLISSVEGLIGHTKFLERSFTNTKHDGIYSSDVVDMEELLKSIKNTMIPKGHSEGESH